MILADKISDLRKKNGWSQEERAEKLDVSRQSISKWEGAQSTPDMNRILKMSELFGVTTDYLLKDQLEMPQADIVSENRDVAETQNARNVSMEEAVSFLNFKETASVRVAAGVFLCVLSPITLIVLAALQEAGRVPMSENAAAGAGLLVLLALVGVAVALFVTTGFLGRDFEYLEKEEIDTAYGVDGMVKDRRQKYSHSYMIQLVAGILVCVLAAVPIFISMLLFGDDDTASVIAIGVLLGLVSIGCFLIVRASIIWGSFQMLLQEGDYTAEHKAESRKNEPIEVIYWCLALTIFLAWSFISNAWDRTWIVWPIAGVGYGVILGIARLLRR